jgi:hypothetical protein
MNPKSPVNREDRRQSRIADPVAPACNLEQQAIDSAAPVAKLEIPAVNGPEAAAAADPAASPTARPFSPSSPRRRLQRALTWTEHDSDNSPGPASPADGLPADSDSPGPSPTAVPPRRGAPARAVEGAAAGAVTPGTLAAPAAAELDVQGRQEAMRLWRSESPARRLRGAHSLFATPPPPEPEPEPEPGASAGPESVGEPASYLRGAPHSQSPGRRNRPSSPIGPARETHSSPLIAVAEAGPPSPVGRRARVRPCSPLTAAAGPHLTEAGCRGRPSSRYFDPDSVAAPAAAAARTGGPRPAEPPGPHGLFPLADADDSDAAAAPPLPVAGGRRSVRVGGGGEGRASRLAPAAAARAFLAPAAAARTHDALVPPAAAATAAVAGGGLAAAAAAYRELPEIRA